MGKLRQLSYRDLLELWKICIFNLKLLNFSDSKYTD